MTGIPTRITMRARKQIQPDLRQEVIECFAAAVGTFCLLTAVLQAGMALPL
jgi:hypothetical protein